MPLDVHKIIQHRTALFLKELEAVCNDSDKIGQNVRDFVEYWLPEIGVCYDEALKIKRSRFSVEWGKWSAHMNRQSRELQSKAENKTEVLILTLLYIYWIEKSSLLELKIKKKFFKQSKKNEKANTIKATKDQILWLLENR